MSEAEIITRIRENVDALEGLLLQAAPLADAILADSRATEGMDDSLVFWPVASPTEGREGSELTNWRRNVDHVLGRL